MQAYYDDGDATDYALISDFETEDFIQLKGSRQDYRIETPPEDLPDGAALYRTIGDNDELIAIIEGTSSLNLDDNSFIFI
ncbi:MAG: hypothetical protein SWJ54_22330 [Cyanobacteriota bacterium]|nr:hypothetical protein [Cyanobacteriota bacterium]